MDHWSPLFESHPLTPSGRSTPDWKDGYWSNSMYSLTEQSQMSPSLNQAIAYLKVRRVKLRRDSDSSLASSMEFRR